MAFIVAASLAAPSNAGAAEKAARNGKMTLSLTAQVNRALMVANDGDQTDTFHVDNDTSPTLFNLTGKAEATDDLTIGTQIEAQMESNSSADVSQATENAATGTVSFTERKLEVFFASKRFGKLWLGQGATASEGISEIDLSGTNVVVRSNFGTFGKSLLFRNSATNTLSATTIGSAFDNFDGLSRDERLRYDTPRVAGLMLSGSALQGDTVDFALRYSRDIGGAKLAAGFAVAHRASTSTTIDNQWSGSGSVLFDNGINLTVAGGVRDMKASGANNPEFYYLKLGYRASWFEAGKTSFSVDGARETDLAADGDEATLFGLGAAQMLDDWGTELYAGFRIYQLDRAGASFDDITARMIGAKVKF